MASRKPRGVRRPLPLDESVLAGPLVSSGDIRKLRNAAERDRDAGPDQIAAAGRVVDVALEAITPAQTLYDLTAAVLDDDARAADEFNGLLDLYSRGPIRPHRDSVAFGLGIGRRVGRAFGPVGLTPIPDRPDPCALIVPGRLGAIAMAAAVAAPAGGYDPGSRMDAVGTVIGCLRGVESLNHAIVDDPRVFSRRVRALGHVWGVRTRPGSLGGLTERRRGVGRRGLAEPGGDGGFEPGLGPDDGPGGFGPGFGPDDGPGGFGPGFGPDDGPGGFGPGLGPDDGPIWCPPVPSQDCELEREMCLIEVIDRVRYGIGMGTQPTAQYMKVAEITAISPAVACPGDKVSILGNGFGPAKPGHLDVVIKTHSGCEVVESESWSDTEIVIVLPPDVTSGCVGFIDYDQLDLARSAIASQNVRIRELNDLLTCLRMGGIPELPLPRVKCPPCTEFNNLQAGLPLIRRFRANSANSGTVLAGEALELDWIVDSADTVTIERTSSAGPLFEGNSSVVDPPGSSYDLGISSHASIQQWSYKLTATNGCGSVTETVDVAATADPGLSVSSIEVTQGIQDTNNGVVLVARKRTVARATIRHALAGFDNDQVPNVTGRIRSRPADTFAWTAWIDPINGSAPTATTPGASITVVAAPSRANTNDTLNFLVPASWCEGQRDYEIEVRVQGYGGSGGNGADDSDRNTFGPFKFNTRKRLDLRFVRVERGATLPTAASCTTTLTRAVHRIPTPGADISELDPSNTETGNSNQAIDDLVDDFDDQHNCSLWEALTEWLGSDCPEDDGAIWGLITGRFFRGIAAGIPANTFGTADRNVPNPGGFTVFELDNKAVHEIAHCFDQLHLELCGAPGGESATTWPNNGQINDVPFDIDANSTVTDPNGIWDIMTWCNNVQAANGNRWTSPKRWQQLYDWIGP